MPVQVHSYLLNAYFNISISNGISFEMRPKGLELYLLNGFTKLRIGLISEQINYWAFEPQKKLLEKKSKSVVGRALVGGILLGPVGAIVGGMTGIGNKEISKSAKGIDNILSISYTDSDNQDHLLVFECSNKKAKKVIDFFNSIFPEIYKEELAEELDNTEQTKLSIADELMKLKSLLDEGLLTREEFDNQKSKLLEE